MLNAEGGMLKEHFSRRSYAQIPSSAFRIHPSAFDLSPLRRLAYSRQKICCPAAPRLAPLRLNAGGAILCVGGWRFDAAPLIAITS
ncbi:hypothetical protein PLANPX_3639 [Lacipirellula parvula]|uniref:Uncharacterized protein n=1 Tax=Lacipirellula parvula TaxID=2650471 RepID=A0A5K7XDC1_9BACT|nr:hypothetical protein PLANPX_3639 [Lacipirellula parvula]